MKKQKKNMFKLAVTFVHFENINFFFLSFQSKKSFKKGILKINSFKIDINCFFFFLFPFQEVEAGTLLPVDIFVHGGSYQQGMGAMFEGSLLALEGIIVINFNYRLGPLGKWKQDLLLPNHFVDSLELKTCSWLIKPHRSSADNNWRYWLQSNTLEDLIKFGIHRHRLTARRMRTGEGYPGVYSLASRIWSSRGGSMICHEDWEYSVKCNKGSLSVH